MHSESGICMCRGQPDLLSLRKTLRGNKLSQAHPQIANPAEGDVASTPHELALAQTDGLSPHHALPGPELAHSQSCHLDEQWQVTPICEAGKGWVLLQEKDQWRCSIQCSKKMAMGACSSGLLCPTPMHTSYHCWLCLRLLQSLMDVLSSCLTDLRWLQLPASKVDMLSR